MTIGVVATLKVQDGKGDEFVAVFKELQTQVLANEPGCKLYQIFQSSADANTYVIMERYEDKAAVDAHMSSEYFVAAQPKMGPCLAGAPDLQFLTEV